MMRKNKDDVVRAYEILWLLDDELEERLEAIEEQIELIREWMDERLKEIEHLLPEDYRHPSLLESDADGLVPPKAKRKK